MGKWPFTRNTDFEIRKVDLDGNYGQEIIATVRDNEMIYHVFEESGGFTIHGYRTLGMHMGPSDMLYYGWGDAIQITVANIDGSIQTRHMNMIPFSSRVQKQKLRRRKW